MAADFPRRTFLFSLFVALSGCLRPRKMANASARSALGALGAEFSGTLITPEDAAYEDARRNRNPKLDVRPALIAMCSSVRDVSLSLAWAKSQKLAVTVRCGGHSYESFSLSSGVVIDVSGLSSIDFAPDGNSIRVGSGNRQGAIYEALAAKGKAIVAGSCPSVGIGGFALGGGYGLLSRAHGMAVDNLLSVEMVDVNGNVVTASESYNQDLFFGLRGAGNANFGVVTAFRFRTYDISKVTVFRLRWSLAEAEKLIPVWMKWAPTTDPRVTSILSLVNDGTLAVVGQFVGTADELQKLFPLWPVSSSDVTLKEVSFIEAVRFFGGNPNGKSPRWKARSDYIEKPFDAAAIAALLSSVRKRGPFSAQVHFDAYGGAISRVEPSAMAFRHRSALACMQSIVYWNKQDDDESARRWLAELAQAVAPHVSAHAYQNYSDLDRKDFLSAYYGEHVERLQALKKKYDPDGILTYAQGLSGS